MLKVLRLGHRKTRDARITTHVCLTARAFGASEVIISGEKDNKIIENVNDVTKRWGGPFKTSYQKNWKKIMKKWEGEIIHLTMYGIPIQKIIEDIRKSENDKLIIVGGPRVPGEIFKVADFNVAVTNQPHSEVSALAVFLHMFFNGKELEKRFENAKIRIIPSKNSKKIKEIRDAE
ncbi:MAG TPA: tRNA (cytidine(56)-2'-O)-methyltransferase [Methanothermobacter sp.]|nr:tRNA (cytidine(56)-2'-O)-methyltransferase [Methanothermobacter sp. MT-2]HHW04561.1 tRNA (cytidine(56)-2'-O)-methyltransferase [Methanothermobacter sp.]HOK72025.1 tRNA (cytidine(56)-2'-O)-methyltransferase [Methanothermobacter sp.]HOL68338.1 tRNA (cytidine(56)-2'-O)-methyltransferase [Methanothermobacter sp.]HPQ04096.1 tRNA (cytidine(56)-2'-O)-methyltransferase [Methanothermobacter sp.]